LTAHNPRLSIPVPVGKPQPVEHREYRDRLPVHCPAALTGPASTPPWPRPL
jgi:hypothetical protein